MKKKLFTLGMLLMPFVLISCVNRSKSEVTKTEKAKTSSDYIAGSMKYNVSQENAQKMLDRLLKGTTLKRPTLDTIAHYNGGTAKDESNENVDLPCLVDEQQFQDIKVQLLNKWRASWHKGNPQAFSKLLANNNKDLPFPKKFTAVGKPVSKNISKYDWRFATTGSFQEYLSTFESIEDFELVTMKISAPRSFRDKNMDIEKAILQVHFDLRGISDDGQRRHDRGPMAVTVEKNGSEWKIKEIQNWGIETLVSNKATFKDVTRLTAVNKIPQYQRLEAIRRGGYAVAVGDYDGDGINDLYVGAHGPSKLLKGRKDGTFEVVENSGLNEDNLVKTAVFADLDNDKKKDLLLIRFSGYTREENENLRSDILIYKNVDGKSFKRAGKILGDTVLNETAMPAAVADFNNDGFLDFYVGYPGNKDFTVVGKIVGREKIKEQGVYINQGNFNFLTKKRMVDYGNRKYDKVTDHQQIFPHSSVAFDFDQDGDVDIVVIDDRGNISPAYQNDGKGNFIQVERHIGVMNKGFGMGLAASDIDNDGRLDMVLTNVNFNAKYRIDNSCRSNWDDEVFGNFDHGLKFYKGLKNGVFSDATGKLGLDFAGEGLAGVEFIDYDNDGFQDLYVANGLWSGNDRDEDLTSIFSRSSLAEVETVIRSHRGARPQSEIMDILSGYKGSLVGKDTKSRLSLAGYQRNRLFRNNGDGSFTEVGYLEGVDSIADGYIIAKSDYDNDGDIDLILRNGDPGTGDVSFEPVQVYRNNNGGQSLRLALVGSKSNVDAIGAEVIAELESTTQMQQVIANNGTAQSETIIHFGMGNNKVVKKLTVKWPSGSKTVLRNLKPGKHTIKETFSGVATAQ